MFKPSDTSSLTPLKLAALATTLLPDKHFTGFQDIDDSLSDYNSTLLIDSNNEQYILRTPSSEATSGRFAAEVQIVKSLQGKFEVPKLIASNSNIAIYQTFRGKAIAPALYSANQVKNLATALARLHSLPYSIIEGLGLPTFTNQQQLTILTNVLDEAALTGKVPPTLLSHFEEQLSDTILWGYDSTVINGDLRPQNIIFDDSEITCVLSWANLQGQDPIGSAPV